MIDTTKNKNTQGAKALVIASNRGQHLQNFLAEWTHRGGWDFVVLVEGNHYRSIEVKCSRVVHDYSDRCVWPVHHFSYREIDERLGDDAWIISRGDAAIKCFGFLAAVELGAEWIVVLDDDCEPHGLYPGGFCQAHLRALDFTACRSTIEGSSAKRRFDGVATSAEHLRPRGLPYANLGRRQALLNMGLWHNYADLDGASSLTPPPWFTPAAGSTLANPLLRYPLCGMNLFFHRSLLPALYFPLMGDGQPYRRFDDIWAGWIFQRVAAHLKIPWSFGEPHVDHVRASDPFRNLVAEAPGIARNETLWQRIDAIELTARDVAGCAGQIAASLSEDEEPYLAQLGRALGRWVELAASRLTPEA